MFLSDIFREAAEEVKDDMKDVESPEVTEEDKEGVQPTEEGYHNISLEASIDLANLAAATLVADIHLGHVYVTEGASAAKVQMEASISSFFDTIKEKIIKIWKKVKAWFLKLVENIKIFFLSPKKFISAYEKEIQSKSHKDFEYKYKAVKNGYDSCKSKFIDKAQALVDEYNTDAKKTDKENKDYDVEEDFFKKASVRDRSALYEALDKEYGLDDDAEEIKAFSKGLDKSAMIKRVKDSSTLESNIKEAQSKSDRAYQDILNALETAKKDYDKDPAANSTVLTNIRKAINAANSAISLKNELFSACITREKEVTNTCVRVLKAFMSSRVKNESYDPSSDFFGSFSL